MNYTRKRALLACDFCRHRKRRCDGERPCSTCRESNASCKYKDLPVERLEPPPGSSEAVADQLNRIENLLHSLVHPAGGVGDASAAFDPGITITLTPTDTPSSYATSASLPSLSPVSADAMIDLQHGPFQNLPYASNDSPYQDYALHTSATANNNNNTTTTAAVGETTSALSSVLGLSAGLGADYAFTPMYPSSGYGHALAQPGHHNMITSSPSSGPTVNETIFQYLEPYHPPQQPQQQQQPPQQPPLGSSVFPREAATSANTLLAMPEVDFLLTHQHNTSFRNAAAARTSAAVPSKSWPFPVSPTLFCDIEAKRPFHDKLNLWHAAWPLPVTDPAQTDTISRYVRAYFRHVYPSTPLVNIGQYAVLSEGMFDDGGSSSGSGEADCSIEKAICLMIWALGALVAPDEKRGHGHGHGHDHGHGHGHDNDQDALVYFQPAFKIIQHHAVWDFGPASLAVCQALLLAASYFAHVGRPLHNARMVHLAGKHLVRLYHQRQGVLDVDAERQRDFSTAFWLCFLWESDSVSELNVPPSGILKLTDHNKLMPKPGEKDDSETIYLALSAEIAAQKLANQARDCLYGPSLPAAKRTETEFETELEYDVVMVDSPSHKRRRGDSRDQASGSTASTILSDTTELHRQLDVLYQAIPKPVQPPLGRHDEHDGILAAAPAPREPLQERAQVLCVQYYAIRHVIHRPFVLSVAWQQQQIIKARERRRRIHAKKGRLASGGETPYPPLPPATIEKCATCVDSCIMFLTHVQPLLEHRSPHLWSLCQTSLACLVVLLVVQACPPMTNPSSARQSRKLQATTVDIARLRDLVANKLSRWASEGSSFQAELRIITSLPVPASPSTLLVVPATPADTVVPKNQQPQWHHNFVSLK